MTSTPTTPKPKKFISSPGTWIIHDEFFLPRYKHTSQNFIYHYQHDDGITFSDYIYPLKNKEPKKEEPKPIPEGWE